LTTGQDTDYDLQRIRYNIFGSRFFDYEVIDQLTIFINIVLGEQFS